MQGRAACTAVAAGGVRGAGARLAGGGGAAAAQPGAARRVACAAGPCRPEPGRGGGGGRSGRGGRGGRRGGPEVNETQVAWDAPISADPVVAIVGGGLSGLACGQVRRRQVPRR
jgi:hypothetical protein